MIYNCQLTNLSQPKKFQSTNSYGKTSFALGILIKSVASSMNTWVELNQLKEFYETVKGDVGTGKRSFQLAIEEANSNVIWKERHYKVLENWLQNEKESRMPHPS